MDRDGPARHRRWTTGRTGSEVRPVPSRRDSERSEKCERRVTDGRGKLGVRAHRCGCVRGSVFIEKREAIVGAAGQPDNRHFARSLAPGTSASARTTSAVRPAWGVNGTAARIGVEECKTQNHQREVADRDRASLSPEPEQLAHHPRDCDRAKIAAGQEVVDERDPRHQRPRQPTGRRSR
jgi:hypothetical protein